MALTMNNIEAAFTKTQFNTAIRLNLYYKIASFLEQGVPIGDVLVSLSKQYGKKKGDIRAAVMREWLAGLGAGRPFSVIVSEWTPPSESVTLLTLAFAS